MLFTLVGYAQNNFYKLYSNNGYDLGEGVAQLEDSSFIVTGTSSSFVEGPSQAFLLKVDRLGDYEWSLPYGGAEEDGARRVLYSPNDGFYISGYTNSKGNGAYDVYTFKTDLSGSLIWEKTFGGAGWEKTNDAILLNDTSQIIVGQTNSGTNGDDDIYVLRINKEGDSLYTKQIGGTGDDFATSIDLLNDSIVIIGGSVYNVDSSSSKGNLIAMHIDGTILWSREYGSDGNFWFNDITIEDSLIYVVGKYYNDTVSDYEGYSGVISYDGSVITEYVFYKEGYDSHELIVKQGTTDKFYIGFNAENSGTYPGGLDFLIMRNKPDLLFDNSGCNFANVGDDIGGHLVATNDGGAILVGTNEAYGGGGSNVALLKIGVNDSYPYTSGYMVATNLVSVPELLFSNKNISFYPNPFLGEFSIESENQKIISFSIFSISGVLVYSEEVNAESIKTNLSFLTEGTYIVEVEDENQIKSYCKVLKARN